MSKLTPHQRKLKALRQTNRSVESLKNEAAHTAVMTLYIMLVYTLYFYYGWKKKRLSRVMRQFMRIYDAVVSGDRTLEQLADELKHDTGIAIDIATGNANIWGYDHEKLETNKSNRAKK